MEMSAAVNDLSEFFMKGQVRTITPSYLHHLPLSSYLSNTLSSSEENDQMRCIFTLLSTRDHWEYNHSLSCPSTAAISSLYRQITFEWTQTASYTTHKRANFSISFSSTGCTFLMCKCFFFDRCTFAANPPPLVHGEDIQIDPRL